MPNLALVGYGKMGQLIESMAPEFGFDVTLKLDEFNNASGEGITAENFKGVDVAVDFSTPDAVVPNVQAIAALGVNIVIGTTGWLDRYKEIKPAIQEIGVVWSPNFSIGVNAFFKIAAEAARILSGVPEYGAWAWEIHHAQKKDAPSGTLAMVVFEMKKAGYERPIDMSSNRAGSHPGTHVVGFDSSADTITLRHTARNRDGFARGALKAAQWVIGKKGFYEFSEIAFEKDIAP